MQTLGRCWRFLLDQKSEWHTNDLSPFFRFSSIRIRQGDKGMLNKLRVSDDIRFRLVESVKSYADKVFLYLQVIFGNVSLDKFATKTENGTPMQIQLAIYNSAPRIAKAILLVATEKEYGGASRAALELVRTVNGMAWEDSATIFRQIDQIGPKSISVLDANGITSEVSHCGAQLIGRLG